MSVAENPSRLHCGHCDEYLSKTVYYQHKRLFYDRRSKKWSKHQVYGDDSLAETPFVLRDGAEPTVESEVNNQADDERCAFQISSQQGESDLPDQTDFMWYSSSDGPSQSSDVTAVSLLTECMA